MLLNTKHKARWLMFGFMPRILVFFLLAHAVYAEIDEIKDSMHGISSEESLARTLFRKKKYASSLEVLNTAPLSLQGTWIAAESHFHLEHYELAQSLYKKLVEESKDRASRRKAFIRMFEIAVLMNDISKSAELYVDYQKSYGQPSARMRYALGKMLYDAQYFDKANKVLHGIKKGNEYYARARYIEAVIGLDTNSAKDSLKLFKDIEDLKPVAAEDYAVKELSILAQGRLLVHQKREDLAEKAYGRVSLQKPYGEVALSELIRAMMNRVNDARLAQGRFAKASALKRKLVERESLDFAYKAIERFRKSREIDINNPELLTLMASLYGEAGRYDDARKAIAELTNYYRPLIESLRQSASTNVWSGLALNFAINKGKKTASVIPGVPNFLFEDLKDFKDLIKLRDRIEDSHNHLEDILSKTNEKNNETLNQAQKRQVALENSYNQMVLKKQVEFADDISRIMNERLAETEFLRARLVQKEMDDIETQIGAAQKFQTEKLETFEHDLKLGSEGGTP